MKILLDTCILYPRILRNIFLDIASQNLFLPFWSDEIINEWKYICNKKNKEKFSELNIEILLLNARWPNSCVSINDDHLNKIFLPDINDRHVLLAAITCKANIILTENIKDFPVGSLNKFGISPRSPESLLLQLYSEEPELIKKSILNTFEKENQISGKNLNIKKVFMSYNISRLSKVIL